MPEDNVEERMQRLAKVYDEFDAEKFEELLSKTQDANDDVRVIAAARLMHLEDPRAVPVVIEMLEDPYPRVRAIAALHLGTYKAATARDKLVNMLRNDENGDVRAMCARSLGDIGGADEEIVRALEDSHPHVKICAINALKWKGKSNAAENIAQLLNDPGWVVRYFASVALMSRTLAP